jgi:hypothetical protein
MTNIHQERNQQLFIRDGFTYDEITGNPITKISRSCAKPNPPPWLLQRFHETQNRSPKKRELASPSPTPQSIPEPFDHGKQSRVNPPQLQFLQERKNQTNDHHLLLAPNPSTGVVAPERERARFQPGEGKQS